MSQAVQCVRHFIFGYAARGASASHAAMWGVLLVAQLVASSGEIQGAKGTEERHAGPTALAVFVVVLWQC